MNMRVSRVIARRPFIDGRFGAVIEVDFRKTLCTSDFFPEPPARMRLFSGNALWML